MKDMIRTGFIGMGALGQVASGSQLTRFWLVSNHAHFGERLRKRKIASSFLSPGESIKTTMIENGSLDLCPKVVDGLQYWPLFEDRRRGNTILMGDKELDRYIKLPESKVPLISEAISYFDGNHTLAWIDEHFRQREGKTVDVIQLYNLLSKSGLLEQSKSTELYKGEFTRLSLTLIRKDVHDFFQRIESTLRNLFPIILTVSTAVILFGFVYIIQDPSVLKFGKVLKIGQSYALGFPLFGAAMIFSYFIHEFSHCVVACQYGLIARSFEFRLYMGFIPVILMNIPGIYTIKPRHRIYVWSAGVYANLAFAGSLMILHHLFPLAKMLDQIAAKVIVSNLIIAARNLIPFLPSDGYFIFATLLKRPNIRTNAFEEFKNWITFKANRFNRFLALYFVLSVLALALVFGLSIARGNFLPLILLSIVLLIPVIKNLSVRIRKFVTRPKSSER